MEGLDAASRRRREAKPISKPARLLAIAQSLVPFEVVGAGGRLTIVNSALRELSLVWRPKASANTPSANRATLACFTAVHLALFTRASGLPRA